MVDNDFPRLPELSGAELRSWISDGSAELFYVAVAEWRSVNGVGRNLYRRMRGGLPGAFSWQPAESLTTLNYWACVTSGDVAEIRGLLADGVIGPEQAADLGWDKLLADPLVALADADAKAAAARDAKKEPGGRAALAAAMDAVNGLQAAADSHYAVTREQYHQQAAELVDVANARQPIPAPLEIIERNLPSWH